MEIYQSKFRATDLEAALQGSDYGRGMQAEYDRFWDTFQAYGNRTDYNYGFYGWPLESFKPKYDIRPSGGAVNMMSGALGGGFTSNPIDLVAHLNECGVVLDFSQTTDISYILNNVGVSHIGVCDFRNATHYTSVFGNDSGLVSIEKIVMPTNQTSGNLGWFYRCSNLEHLVIEGAIKLNGMDLSANKKLTHDSIMSVINALENKTSGTFTLTLGSTNLAKLTDAEKAIATGKGWTLA